MIIIIASFISGLLYRAGGYGKPFNTLYRDLGCPACVLTALALMGVFNGAIGIYILSFGLMWLPLTTYHKWANFFFKKSTSDCYWFNYFAHGLCIGLSLLPFLGIISIWLIISRAVILGIAISVWSMEISNDNLEEFGRGAFIVASLPILLI